jgi:hypothetical protein
MFKRELANSFSVLLQSAVACQGASFLSVDRACAVRNCEMRNSAPLKLIHHLMILKSFRSAGFLYLVHRPEF